MGRKVKKGLDYFPLYHDFFTSKKIKALRRAHGSIGILTYLNILCKVYDHGYYYRFDSIDELSMDIAEEISNIQLRATATGVTETINYLVGQGILDEGLFKQGIISGVALQEQYANAAHKAKRKIEMNVYCLLQKKEVDIDVSGSTPKNQISSEENTVFSEETPICSEKSTQRKEEENKNKDSSFLSLGRKITLSEAEKTELKANLDPEDLNYYIGVIISCENNGKCYKRKSHYQAILDMAKQDGKYGKTKSAQPVAEKSYDLDEFYETALKHSMDELSKK